MKFRWNDWNEEHIGAHDIEPEEAEEILLGAKPPFPLVQDDEKYLVWGATEAGRLRQVVFVMDADDTVFVIHARALTAKEKKRFRRRMR